VVEEPQIIVHECDEPDALADLFNSDGLTSRGFADADLFPIDEEPAAAGDRAGVVVERVLDFTDTGVGAGEGR
jgi:hypothetical protein